MNLNDPTPPSEIKKRQGPGGRTLDYIDARFVMDRLDAAVGQENWQDKFEDLPNGSVRCGIGIRQKDGWVWKWDVGDVSDIEPVKGAHSDAFKRAAVKWGIGRDLYGDHPALRPASPPAAAQGKPLAAVKAPPDEPPWPVDAVPSARPSVRKSCSTDTAEVTSPKTPTPWMQRQQEHVWQSGADAPSPLRRCHELPSSARGPRSGW
jgi:hypothetical protein